MPDKQILGHGCKMRVHASLDEKTALGVRMYSRRLLDTLRIDEAANSCRALSSTNLTWWRSFYTHPAYRFDVHDRVPKQDSQGKGGLSRAKKIPSRHNLSVSEVAPRLRRTLSHGQIFQIPFFFLPPAGNSTLKKIRATNRHLCHHGDAAHAQNKG